MRAGGITPDADSRAVNVVIRRLRSHPAHGELHVAELRREDVFGRQPVRAGNGNITAPGDRKSVVSGKSVSVRVDTGGRRIIKKKKYKRIRRQVLILNE